MEWDPSLRTLYRLAERVEGDELERVRAAIAKRRSDLDLEDAGASSPAIPAAPPPRDDETWTPPTANRFRPLARDEVPRLIRRPGERKNRIAPRDD